MRKIFLLITVLLSVNLFSQTPQSFKYQAVVRDASSQILVSQNVDFKISILEGTASGNSVYTEIHSVQTNQFGLVNITIGTGATSDVFEDINWGDNHYFIKTEIDLTQSGSFQEIGVSQLLSVPYAIVADSALKAPSVWTKSGNDIIYNAGNVSVGNSSQFNVNSTGNITKINNVTTNFPSTQANANTYLKNDGSGNLSWETPSVQNQNTGIYNVMDYGAMNNGTNSAVTTIAINNAVTDLLENATFKGVLYFPPGKYLISTKIDITLPNAFSGITVRGDGPGISVLTFEASATGGLDVSFTAGGGYENQKGSVIIKDLTVETMGVANGSGIYLHSTNTSSPAPHKIIENITLTGLETTNYWTYGIRLTDITFANINGVQYQGKSDDANWEGIAVLIEGENNPVDNFINNLRVWNSDKAVEITGTNEGVTITQSIFLAINKGVHWHTNTGGHEPWLGINNCHISASEECVMAEQLMQCQINNNLFYCQAKAGVNWAGIWFSSDAAVDYDYLQISHNTIHGFDNAAIRNGILLNNVKNSLLMGNIFHNTITGISLNNVTNTKVYDNLNFSNANEVVQSGCTGIVVR